MTEQDKSEVEEFIDDFVNKTDCPDVILKQFANGYCYHFAIILKNNCFISINIINLINYINSIIR